MAGLKFWLMGGLALFVVGLAGYLVHEIRERALLEHNFEQYKKVVEKEREFNRAKDRQAQASKAIVKGVAESNAKAIAKADAIKRELDGLEDRESSPLLKETIRRLQ